MPDRLDDRLRTAAAHIIVADLERPEPADEDLHHLSRVLRLRDGEAVTATDGAGRWRLCEWRAGALVSTGEIERGGDRPPAITIGFVPVKGDRPEWVVQKLTELGVDRIVILSSERAVVRWEGPRLEHQLDRLRRVARGSVGQARLCTVPRIEAVGSASALPGALAHFDGGPVSLDDPSVLIGPEGGWSDAELDGARRVGLGPTVLRAETAAITAGGLLTALRNHTLAQRRHIAW